MSALSNPLTTYDDVLNHYETSGFGDRATPEDFRTNAVEQALEGLEQDANGHYFRGDERVYVYHDSSELGDDSNGFKGENIVMRTEAEIREAWEADEGMGYFKEANPNLDFDTYMEFISEKDDLYASGELDLNPHDDLYNVGHKGRGPKSDAINAILAEEKDRVRAAEAAANGALQEKYGIETSFSNDDGDQFEFNGSTYTKTMKVDDHLGAGDYVKMGAGVLMSVYAGPMIAGSLGSFMGPAMAKAASSAIISQATAFMNGQGLSIGDALQSAAMSYGGAKLGDMFSSGGELSGTVSEITDKVTSATDKFNELITTGNSIADAAIKAGGMSMLTSLVMTGEVDLEAAGLAAVMAGGAEGLGQLGNSLTEAGATPEEVDEFMADLSESEEFQQAAMDADIKDPFLNPNYTTVGDGLMTNSAGDIFNYAGDAIGNMSDLDLDGDGVLNANDLQNITTPDRDLKNPDIGMENEYGNAFPAVPDSTTNPTLFTDEWVSERYGELSESQTIAAMEQDGFTDEQIEAYVDGRYDDIDIANPNMVTHAGGWVENMEQPYTLEYRDGRHYIIMDGKLKAISEDAYIDLYADLEQGVSPEQWSSTMDKHGVGDGGSIFGGYDEYGRPVYTKTESVDDWITLDGSQPPISAPIDDFIEATEEVTQEVEKPEEVVQKDSTDSSSLNGAEGLTGDSGSTPSTPSSSEYTEIEIAQIAQASNIPLQAVIAALNAGATPEQIVNDPAIANDPSKIISEEDGDVIPNDGTGTPVAPPMNVRIEQMMANGATYEEAVANQNAAINAGADANNDGMVTNAEWSAHTTGDADSSDTVTGGSNSTTGKDVADNTVVADGGDNVTNGTGDDGTGDEVVAGDNTGSDAVDDGSGAVDDVTTTGPGVVGTDNGPGEGPVEGPGGNGPGVGLGGNGLGMLGGGGGSGTPEWGPLFPGTQFKKFNKRRTDIVQSLFEDLMK
jgi:hypothetical protein